MPEPASLTIDFTWLKAALTMGASATVIAVACIGGCRHVRNALMDVLAELHANTLATRSNGDKLGEIETQLINGNKRFGTIEQKLSAHETAIDMLKRGAA